MEQVDNCDLCNGKFFKPYLTFEEYGEKFNLVKCETCGLLFINPRPAPDEIGKYYPDDYSPYNESGLGRLINSAVFNVDSRYLGNFLNPGSKILEIGCASGNYLAYLRDKFGCQAYGVEYSPYAADLAKNRGLDVKVGLLDEVELEAGFYDFIIMRHVLEHVHSPRKTLDKVSACLKKGGHFFCTVPNAVNIEANLFGTKWSNWDIPRHLFHYTANTLGKYFDKTGLETVNVTYGKIPNDYIKSCSKYLPNAFKPFFNIYNPVLIGAFLPLSLASGIAGKSGRITVTAKKL